MSKLSFYTNPISCGRIVHWLLEELKLEYDTISLEYGTTMKSKEYLAINPLGKVPAIKHGDVIVTECAAICTYLAESFTNPVNLSLSTKNKGEYYKWMFFIAGPFMEIVNLRTLGVDIPEDKEEKLGAGNQLTALDMLRNALTMNPYLTGDRFTAVDILASSRIIRAIELGLIESYPEFIGYWDRVGNRPARLRAVELAQGLLKNNSN